MHENDKNFYVAAGQTPEQTSGTESAHKVSPSDEPDRFDKRRKLIAKHMDESISRADTLDAILGSVGSDLMLLQLQTGEALRDSLGQGRVSIDELREFEPDIKTFVQLSKQLTQTTEVRQKLRVRLTSTPGVI